MNARWLSLILAVSIVPLACLPFLFPAPSSPQQAKSDEPFRSPVLFNTPQADALLSQLQVFPPDNAWNLDVSQWSVHPDSDKLIASVGAEKPLRYNQDMAFVLVPPDQPRIAARLTDYADESDPGPYPIPDNMPIEDWPLNRIGMAKHQRQGEGDRHGIVVDPINRKLYEFYQARLTDGGWQAAQASIFDLSSNKLRRDGWTSADAAGLPIFPAVVRYDELARGQVTHALRFTVRRTRKAYVHPATHYASKSNDPTLPRMGERFRLKPAVDVSRFSKHARVIVKALQTHGMLVADNGSDWFMSIAPDARIVGLEDLRRIKGKDFEVVQAH